MTDPAHLAHITLRLGRLMLARGADTQHIETELTTFAAQAGSEAHLLVTPAALLITVQDGGHSFTKLGPAIPGLAVDMGALDALDAAIRTTVTDPALDAIEHAPSRYAPWQVALGMALTAACLARLFGGPWSVTTIAALVGLVNTLLRQRFAAWRTHPIIATLATAGLSGLGGALLLRALSTASPTLCLVTAGMILVPGVPLLNGIRDALSGHTTMALARLTQGALTLCAIATGLLLAAALAGDAFPVASQPSLLPTAQDMLFSGLAAIGYALLFNVPPRAIWACILCGVAGHGLRTALLHAGLDITSGSLAGALAAGLLAAWFGRRFTVPAVTFAFPGVVAMIPGAYAFRAATGALAIMRSGAAATPALLAETSALAITTLVMTAAIAIGLALALAARR